MPSATQDVLLRALVETPADQLPLDSVDRALVRYADRLTREPAVVSVVDISALRGVGLDDRAIHDACAIVAYFGFVNRIADGLGIELEGA
ncbi:MAG: carboxymuconolactone decarboxylase family protein [Gemmatimonadaceae bacterium]